MERVVSDLNIFSQKWSKIAAAKKVSFIDFFFICSLLRYHLKFFLHPLFKVGCSKLLEIRNPWKKYWKEVVSDLNIFAQKWTKIAAAKKVFADFFLYLFTFQVPFKRLFAPTLRSRMSKLFWVSESSGKSIGKKWSQIWTFLLKNCLKLPRQKKVFFTDLFFFVHSI